MRKVAREGAGRVGVLDDGAAGGGPSLPLLGPYEPWGMAVLDHALDGRPRRFQVVDSDGTCAEHSSAEAFTVLPRLRSIEQAALALCRGRVLDVGAGAGRHSIDLMNRGLAVLPIDLEPRCVEVMRRRGLAQARHADAFTLAEEGWDTVLLLQQTIGVVGTLERLTVLLGRFAGMLAEDGQVLLDSAAPRYRAWSPAYPGQRCLQFLYAGHAGAPVRWLYVDFDVLRACAGRVGLEAELVTQGSHARDYLACLTRRRRDRPASIADERTEPLDCEPPARGWKRVRRRLRGLGRVLRRSS